MEHLLSISLIHFHIKCPIFIARQWFRHRIGSFNEISLRYTEYEVADFWIPKKWRTNNKQNKQSSSIGEITDEANTELLEIYEKALAEAELSYRILLNAGVAREQARAVLPVSAFTEFYWTVNARSLFNFINLRTAEEAQLEMQDYANAIYKCVKQKAPWTFEAFENKRR